MEITRTKRKFWQKKTNWVIALGIFNNLMPIAVMVPGIGLPVVTVVNIIAGSFGLYAVADRAGKPNESE